jgi:hypothetical protein
MFQSAELVPDDHPLVRWVEETRKLETENRTNDQCILEQAKSPLPWRPDIDILDSVWITASRGLEILVPTANVVAKSAA